MRTTERGLGWAGRRRSARPPCLAEEPPPCPLCPAVSWFQLVSLLSTSLETWNN